LQPLLANTGKTRTRKEGLLRELRCFSARKWNCSLPGMRSPRILHKRRWDSHAPQRNSPLLRMRVATKSGSEAKACPPLATAGGARKASHPVLLFASLKFAARSLRFRAHFQACFQDRFLSNLWSRFRDRNPVLKTGPRNRNLFLRSHFRDRILAQKLGPQTELKRAKMLQRRSRRPQKCSRNV
jgi:hypothetical protein